MKNTTYRIRFIILGDENEVLKNFLFTDREYNTREEACEVAQTICCVLNNYCGWNVFYRVVVPANAAGGTFHDDGEGNIVPDENKEEYDGEEENCSLDEIPEEHLDEFLTWIRDYLNEDE